MMVKYIHCKRCNKVYTTETWIGEAHIHNGMCSACIEIAQQETNPQKESADGHIMDKIHLEQIKRNGTKLEKAPSSSIEIEKAFLLNLVQKAEEVLYIEGSIEVFIKEIKDDLLDKAKERIGDTIQSFDLRKNEAQKVIDYAEKTFDYLSDYKHYMDNVIKKLKDNPKLNVKSAIEKVLKETIASIPKNIAKEILLNKKEMIKTVFTKAVKWYEIYSDMEDAHELTNKMMLHPFNQVQQKFSTLPFYTSK